MRRKNVLKYDEVMNEQRRVIYDQRAAHPRGRGLRRAGARDGRARSSRASVRAHARGRAVLRGLGPRRAASSACRHGLRPGASRRTTSTSSVGDARRGRRPRRRRRARASTTSASSLIGEEQMRNVERAVMLQVIDARWKEHLLDMDYLQEGIHLRALGQRDPLVEYKGEGFDLFQDMLEGIKTSTVTTLHEEQPRGPGRCSRPSPSSEPLMALNYTSGDDLDLRRPRSPARRMAAGDGAPPTTARRRAAAQRGRRRRPRRATTSTRRRSPVQQRVVYEKVGRNDPCPCGSGQEVQEVPRRVSASLRSARARGCRRLRPSSHGAGAACLIN